MDSGLALHGIHERVSGYEGLSSEFLPLFQEILSANTRREAADRAAAAMYSETGVDVFTITEQTAPDEYTIVHNYQYGAYWQFRVGTVTPGYSLSNAVGTVGRPVYWALDAVAQAHEDWFKLPYYIGVPVLAPEEPHEVTGTFVLGISDAGRFADSTATVADFVARAYSAALDRISRVDRGIEIGRAIEQQRLVQRLHDTTVQEIFACECRIEELASGGLPADDAAYQTQMRDLLERLRATNRGLRKVLADVRDDRSAASEASLRGAIERAVSVHERVGGCPAVVITSGDARVSQTVADVVVSVAGEALANVRKHARATNALVSCAVDDGILALSIRDDGVGIADFEPSEMDEGLLHFGLRNMAVMVERVGGTFEVVSDPDEGGTAVLARIPIGERA